MLKQAIAAIGIAVVMAVVGNAAAQPTDAQKCSSKMRRCAGRFFLACTKCYAKEAVTGDATAAAACIAKQSGKYDKCQRAVLDQGGCLFGDPIADHIQDEILNSWCPDVVAETPPS